MLKHLEGVEVAAAVTSSEEAIGRIIDLKPDVVFLDIEMPGSDGFDVVEKLSRSPSDLETVPFVVFVTAHPQFASLAYDAGAIDYLMKPVRAGRLEACLLRARHAVEARSVSQRLAELQKSFKALQLIRQQPKADREHIWIQRRAESVRLDMDDVVFIRAEAEYVRLFVKGASYLHRAPIGAIEQGLDPEQFLRIHRSTIVRKAKVVGMKRSAHGGVIIRLATGDEFPVGRKYAKEARSLLVEAMSMMSGISTSADDEEVG